MKSLIVVNTSKEESKKLAHDISQFLNARKIETEFMNFDGFSADGSFSGFDFVVTLGGDGTVLFAARNCVEKDIPVFPVNLGEFGFIASIQTSEWEKALIDFLDNKSPIVRRMMLNIEVIRGNKKIESAIALNDLVISAKISATTVSLYVHYDDLLLCRLKSDGVIFSTPTGSTAYSASAGGPIVSPEMDAFIMTPLNSFSLSSRPIVLHTDGVLSVTVKPSRTKEICMTVDGQPPISLMEGDVVRITKLDKKIRLVECTSEKFYNALRSKLNWSGVPHA